MVQDFMKINHKNIFFHHTGIVTKDIELSKDFFLNLGYSASTTFKDEPQGSFIVVLKKSSSSTIELISPMNEHSPSYGWLKRIGGGAYHICYEIKDANLVDGIDYFKSLNFTPISKPTLSPAFNGASVVFLWGSTGGLIELLGFMP